MTIETFDARRIRTNVGVGNKAENDKAVFIHFQCDTTEQATALWRALYAMWQAGHFKIETKPAKLRHEAEAEHAR